MNKQVTTSCNVAFNFCYNLLIFYACTLQYTYDSLLSASVFNSITFYSCLNCSLTWKLLLQETPTDTSTMFATCKLKISFYFQFLHCTLLPCKNKSYLFVASISIWFQFQQLQVCWQYVLCLSFTQSSCQLNRYFCQVFYNHCSY